MSSFSKGDAAGRTTSQRRAVGVRNSSWQTAKSRASNAAMLFLASLPWLMWFPPAT